MGLELVRQVAYGDPSQHEDSGLPTVTEVILGDCTQIFDQSCQCGFIEELGKYRDIHCHFQASIRTNI